MTPTAELLIPEVHELVQQRAWADLREALHHVPPADVAEIFTSLNQSDAALAFRFLQRDDAGDVFSYMSPELQERLIKELGTEDAVRVIDAMEPDDRVRLLDELPGAVCQRIVASLPPESRRVTQAILGYPAGSVGRLMTPDYVRIRPEWTVAQAVDHVRRYGRDAETINVVYVIDEQGKLIDDLRLRQVLLADPVLKIADLMNQSFYALRADDPQQVAVQMMRRYDRTALPVVDSRGVLVGIVTHDDVADVAEQQATNDMQRLGGVQALEQSYIQTGHIEMFRKRGVWLAVLFVGQTVTILVLGSFQDQIDKAVILTIFMPLVMSCGGNSGSQAATLVTRALALGEITPKDWFRVVRKELISASLLAASLAAMGFACVMIFTSGFGHPRSEFPIHVAATVAVAIAAVVTWGTSVGSLLPLILRRCKLDPATASTPMVATLMDASGTLIYLGFAILILSGRLL